MLAAEGIAARVVAGDGAWRVELRAAELERGSALLEEWRSENARPLPPPPEAALLSHGWHTGAWLAAGIVASHAYTGRWSDDSLLFARGAMSVGRVLRGELARVFTGLTLHSDWPHALGNAASALVFASLLARRLGAGAALLVLVASGALGNLLTVSWRYPPARSVGASTALFGAVGALAGLELARRRALGARTSRLWLPLAAGLALVAMLGTGKDSDQAAHIFGLASGSALGFAAARFSRFPQPACAALALGALALAWAVQLGL